MSYTVIVKMNIKSKDFGWFDFLTNVIFDKYERQLGKEYIYWSDFLSAHLKEEINANLIISDGSIDHLTTYKLTFPSEKEYLIAKLKWA